MGEAIKVLPDNIVERLFAEIKAMCDKNPRKAGETVDGIVISDVRFLPEVVKKHQIELGILPIPALVFRKR